MARKFTPEVGDWLLEKIQFLYEAHGLAFVGIKIDGLGNLLLTRLTTPSQCNVVKDFTHQAGLMSGSSLYSLASTVSGIHVGLLQEITGKNCVNGMATTLFKLMQHHDNLEHEAPRLLPLSVNSMITMLLQLIQHGDNLIQEAPRLRTPNFNIMITSFLQLSQHADNFEQAAPRLLTSRFYSTISTLLQLIHHGGDLERAASRLLTPLISSSLGSVIASRDIHLDHSVSPEALTWLALGLNSDAASSRLKLASVYYCVGNFNRTEDMLNKIADIYDQSIVEAACSCNERIGNCFLSGRFMNYAYTHNELAIKHIVAFCVKFIPDEVYCQPRELQYEMFRSTRADRAHRDLRYDHWMDWALVDSLPYLYFLQYKTYRHTQRYDKQQQALRNLALSIHTTRNLIHKETALNLLGQCYQQENRHAEALQCYIDSLNVRPTNNAAKLHISRLIYALYSRNNYHNSLNKAK